MNEEFGFDEVDFWTDRGLGVGVSPLERVDDAGSWTCDVEIIADFNAFQIKISNDLGVEVMNTETEEEGAKDVTLSRTLLTHNGVDDLSLVKQKQKRWMRITKIGKSPRIFELSTGKELLHHDIATHGVEGILKVNPGDNPIWMLVDDGLDGMNCGFTATRQSDATLDWREEFFSFVNDFLKDDVGCEFEENVTTRNWPE